MRQKQTLSGGWRGGQERVAVAWAMASLGVNDSVVEK
jgi:hypothetical protein